MFAQKHMLEQNGIIVGRSCDNKVNDDGCQLQPQNTHQGVNRCFLPKKYEKVSHQVTAMDSCFGLIRPRLHGLANKMHGSWVPT